MVLKPAQEFRFSFKSGRRGNTQDTRGYGTSMPKTCVHNHTSHPGDRAQPGAEGSRDFIPLRLEFKKKMF